MEDERAPKIKPVLLDLPVPAVPATVHVGPEDADLSLADWDRQMGDEHAGMLDAVVAEAT